MRLLGCQDTTNDLFKQIPEDKFKHKIQGNGKLYKDICEVFRKIKYQDAKMGKLKRLHRVRYYDMKTGFFYHKRKHIDLETCDFKQDGSIC